MAPPRSTPAQRLYALTDHLVHAAQMASAWSVDCPSMFVTPRYVHVEVRSIDDGRKLARVLNLDDEDVDTYPFGYGMKVSTRWQGEGSPVTVMCVLNAEAVGRAS